jgi:hypothetical protein
VQVIGETFDTRGSVTNITSTETRTTLLAVAENSYTLRVDVTVEISGKRFPPQVQTVKYGYFGETPEQTARFKSIGEGEVQIDGRTIPVEKRQITIVGDDFEAQTVVHYSNATPPYQLKRETSTAHTSEAKSSNTSVEVVALELPQRVLGDVKSAATVKTIKKHAQGTSVTVETHCDDVPGGVVAHAAAERDGEGHVTRRSTLQIVDYSIGIGRIEEPASVVRRRKYNRARRRGDEIYIAPAPR